MFTGFAVLDRWSDIETATSLSNGCNTRLKRIKLSVWLR